jgi:hypothetical protein
MADEQYVLQFKFLRFVGGWANGAPVSLPQGLAYTAQGHSTLVVVVHVEPDKFKTLTFGVAEGRVVGVSVPENLVFIPHVGVPKIQDGLDPIFK